MKTLNKIAWAISLTIVSVMGHARQQEQLSVESQPKLQQSADNQQQAQLNRLSDEPAALNEEEATDRQKAQKIVEQIDSYRGFKGESFSFVIHNISYSKRGKGDNAETRSKENKLRVSVLAEQSLVQFLEPVREKGRVILKEGRNMWLYMPGTSKVIRITPSQRLIGEASNGDVTGTNFSFDYTPSIIGHEVINEQNTIKLEMVANQRGATYERIEFFVTDDERHLPVQSNYYARSGKLLKQAFYREFKEFDGQTKIHKMMLRNPLLKDSVTWLMFDEFKREEINPAMFNKDSLSRL